MLKALSFLHDGLSIAHRDIKPQNILFDVNHEVKLADFGTSKKVEKVFNDTYQKFTAGTSTGFQGTLGYLSPEQVQKRKRGEQFSYDPFKSDMWSLGITLYQFIFRDQVFKVDNTLANSKSLLKNMIQTV